MGGLEVAALIFSLVTTYGPKAKTIYDDWKKGVSEEPTPDEWAALKKKIDDHTPDTY